MQGLAGEPVSCPFRCVGRVLTRGQFVGIFGVV
jgi:hypothetical protein